MKYCTSIVDKSIQLVRQSVNQEARMCLSLPQYMREFRTIQLLLPRQVGKSTYIKTHATEDDIILYPSLLMLHHHGKGVANAFASHTLINFKPDAHPAINQTYNIIWLDEFSVNDFHGKDTQKLLDALVKSGDEIIVSLSTLY
ncbi:hypothetical protein M0R04_07290 [Candidatus Dojkabacteria bacterium]|jgi:hypothetical protein|nr:hypothetical protein [Candidatus Dojkabacteria bacterium]